MDARDATLATLSPERYDILLRSEDFDPVIDVPMGVVGDYHIEKVSLRSGYRLAMLGRGGFVRFDGEVILTQLFKGTKLWMSNSPSEIADMRWMVERANGGHVLIAGLGLGILPFMLGGLTSKVTVVEISSEVIQLVGPYLPKNVDVVQADFREWVLEEFEEGTYTSALLDIWSQLSTDDLSDMLELLKWLNLPGTAWGLDHLVGRAVEGVLGWESPDDTADALEECGWPEWADYIRRNYGGGYDEYSDEGEDWSDEEEDALWYGADEVYGRWL